MSLRLVSFSTLTLGALGAILFSACSDPAVIAKDGAGGGASSTTTTTTTTGAPGGQGQGGQAQGGAGGQSTGGAGGAGGAGGGPTCIDGCPDEGAVRCIAAAAQTCHKADNGCLGWSAATACPVDQTCNAAGSGCVDPTGPCQTDDDCGCAQACVAGECKGMGAIPPSCATDADCGPACLGFACVSGQCAASCLDTCASNGATRCVGNAIETCAPGAGGCLAWGAATACPDTEVCDANGAACLALPAACQNNAECGCAQTCVAGECKGMGAFPPSCATDADCGPPCLGVVCIAGACAASLPVGPADLCVKTGGTIGSAQCCLGASDFPDLCTEGPCGCGPDASHSVQICQCPGQACFSEQVGCTGL